MGGAYVTISDGQLQSVPYARSASNGVPVGSIIPFGGPKSAIPEGWLACDGAQLNKTNYKYKQLFDVIGYSWGGGSDLFNIPELRGYFLRGVSDGQTTDPDRDARTGKAGGNTGDNVGSYEGDVFASHNHTENAAGVHNHTDKWMSENDNSWSGGGSHSGSYTGYIQTGTTSDAGSHTHAINAAGGNETRPKNAYVWFIIKY